MEDPRKGGSPPDSGASGAGGENRSGKNRWKRWKKTRKKAELPFSNSASSPAEDRTGSENLHPPEAASTIGSGTGEYRSVASAQGQHPGSQIAVRNGGYNEFGKKRTRRRRRRKSKSSDALNSTKDQNLPEIVGNEQERHRRQPMPQEVAAEYTGKSKDAAKSSPGNGYQAKPDRNKWPQGLAHHSAFHYKKQKRTFYAALDLGTNNCRLLVALPQAPGRFRVVDSFSQIVRLGEGLGSSGRLRDDAMERTIAALKACREKLCARVNTRHRLIATEACRQAENGQDFLDRVLEETGLKLEIVDRATEARLAVSGCSTLVDRKAGGVVLFDIGGGSSELALLDISNRRSRQISDHILSWVSLPVGVVTLSEKFGGGKNVTPQIFEDMVIDVVRRLDQFEGRHALAHAIDDERFHLLGTSGTVTTLAGVHLNLQRYDRRRVDGAWLSNEDVDAMINRILHMSFEDRVNNPCIGADRADLVLAGCAILEAIRRLWPSRRLRVADRGLREGMLTELMDEDGVWRKYRRKPRPGSKPRAGQAHNGGGEF